ncbi:MAG: VanW family protein [Acidimicrobiia bacterium]|nr:VanW family protein [Acidimicrobiia bacterium]
MRRGAVAAAAVLFLLTAFYVFDRLVSGNEIGRRVEVSGVDVAGLTPEEARVTLQKRANELLTDPVTVQAEEATFSVPPADLEADIDVDAAVEEAMQVRNGWNPVSWFTGFFSTRSLTFEEIRMSPDKVREIVAPALTSATIEPRNAAFEVSADGESVSIAPSALGRGLDIEAAMTDIESAIRADGAARRALVPLSDLEPELTTAEAEQMGIKDQVGSFTTEFPEGEERVKNIERISEILDGTTIPPGDRFSVNEKVGKRTPENGFVSAPVIYDGEYKDDIGGGVSQYATTLYNAAWFAGVPIKEHKAHSFYISRYPLGRDATLSYPHPDLAFVNDYDTHLLVKSWVGESSVTVALYSTKDGRSVESETGEPYDHKEPEIVRREDKTLKEGTEKVSQSPKQGYSVDTFRTITYASGQTKEEKVTTVYVPQNKIILYTAVPPPTTTPTAPTTTAPTPAASVPTEPPPGG